jgi:hypothetical protein
MTEDKPKPKLPPEPEEDTEKKVVRIWPEHLKRPIPRYRIEDTNPGD